MVILEENNKKLNARMNEKDRKFEELNDRICVRKRAKRSHFQPKNWSSFFDKKENHVKNTESELIMMAHLREESRARKVKEKISY